MIHDANSLQLPPGHDAAWLISTSKILDADLAPGGLHMNARRPACEDSEYSVVIEGNVSIHIPPSKEAVNVFLAAWPKRAINVIDDGVVKFNIVELAIVGFPCATIGKGKAKL